MVEGKRAVEKTVDGEVGSSKQTTKEESSRISDASSRACRPVQRMNDDRDKFSDINHEIREKERTGDHSSGIESQEKRLLYKQEEKAFLQAFYAMSNSKTDSSQKSFEKTGQLKSLHTTVGTTKIDDQSFQAICDHHADQKKEETNTQVQCGNSNVRINPNHNRMTLGNNQKLTTPTTLHIHPAGAKIAFREVLMVSAKVTEHSNIAIYTRVRNDTSTEVIIPGVVKIQLEADAVKEMKTSTSSCSSDDVEIVKVSVEKQINYLSNSDGDTSFDPGYTGDDEGKHDVNDNLRKVLRKRFGDYPLHRTRLNGVTWTTGYSSDDDGQRGSDRRYRQQSVGRGSEDHKTTNDIQSYQGSDEDSEPVTIHVLPSKKIKAFKKRRMNYEEVVDTTCSEASDVESLTDCSLCLSDNCA